MERDMPTDIRERGPSPGARLAWLLNTVRWEAQFKLAKCCMRASKSISDLGVYLAESVLERSLLRHDRVGANLRGELYPEIAAVWGLAFAIFLEWEGARLQPEEIRLGVIVTILGVFLTRIVAIVRGAKGWSYV